MSELSVASCISSFVMYSLTRVGMPANALRIKLRCLRGRSEWEHKPSLKMTYLQKSLRHTASRTTSMFVVSSGYSLPQVIRTRFKQLLNDFHHWFNDFLKYLKGELNLLCIWHVPGELEQTSVSM